MLEFGLVTRLSRYTLRYIFRGDIKRKLRHTCRYEFLCHSYSNVMNMYKDIFTHTYPWLIAPLLA